MNEGGQSSRGQVCPFILLLMGIDPTHDTGHSIHALYLSGLRAQNAALMCLVTNAYNMPVVLGAAMLGRFAMMCDPEDPASALWDIMHAMTPPATPLPRWRYWCISTRMDFVGKMSRFATRASSPTQHITSHVLQ